MTKQETKVLKTLSFFNKSFTHRESIFNDKIFVHNDIMYATDGRIFCWTKNVTEHKDFSFYKGKKFDYLSHEVQEVKEDAEALNDGEKLEKIIQQFNYFPFTFELDFSDYPLPVKLTDSFNERYFYNNTLSLDFNSEEATFYFHGGADEEGGVTSIYGDIIKNVSGEKVDKIELPIWYVIKVMELTKVKTIHFKCYPERNHISFTAGDYNFLATTYNTEEE